MEDRQEEQIHLANLQNSIIAECMSTGEEGGGAHG